MGRGRCIRMKEWMTETRDTREGERRDGREVWWKEGAGGWEAMEWGIQDFFSGRKIKRERESELVMGKLGKKFGVDSDPITKISEPTTHCSAAGILDPVVWNRSRPKSSEVIRCNPETSIAIRSLPLPSGVVGSGSRLEI